MSSTGSSGGKDRTSDTPLQESASKPLADAELLLNPSVLHELEQDMGGAEIVISFVTDFVRMWDARVENVRKSLEVDEQKLAHDALLSLKNSAYMVGATRLGRITFQLEQLVTSGDLAAARLLLPDLVRIGDQTMVALRREYLNYEPG